MTSRQAPAPRCVGVSTPSGSSVHSAVEPVESISDRRELFALRLARRPYKWTRKTLSRVFFDRRYGVRTEDELELESLGVAAPHRCGYMPYARRSLARILPAREVSDQDVFLDAGSGMGRVVLQAALRYRCRRVIGVEVSPDLHKIAEVNINQSKNRLRCPHITLVRSDVLNYRIPDDVTIVFLFNPFDGQIFERFIQELLDSIDRTPRVIRLVYGNPVEERALLATGRATSVRLLRGWRPTRDWSRSNSTRMYLLAPSESIAAGATPHSGSSVDRAPAWMPVQRDVRRR